MQPEPSSPAGRVSRHHAAVSRRGPISWRAVVTVAGSIAAAIALIAVILSMLRTKADKIEARLKQSAAVVPNNAGVAASGRGDFDEARRNFDEAIHLSPDFALAWANRGSLRIDLGDLAGGDADLSKALQLDPFVGEAWARRAEGRARAGQLELAASDAEAAVAKAPALASTWRARGFVRHRQGNLNGALEDYDHSIALTPSSFTLLDRGLLRRQLRDDPGAMRDFEAALDLDDRFVPAWVAWARVSLDAGTADKAEAASAKALAVWPDDAGALLVHAEALITLNRRAEATMELKHLLRVADKDSPEHADAERLMQKSEK
ncbi:MAG: hypothetical protein K8T20_04645 [Planctomycetes bacterium]|nr:hypothetical protein [Planctomycetota bacterium]